MKKINIESNRSIFNKHVKLLKALNKQSVLAYRFISKAMIDEIMRKMWKEKLTKSEGKIGVGWTGEISKVEVDLEDISTKVLKKYMDALRWVMIGDYAGKESRDAAKKVGLFDKVTPGLMQSSYLSTIDLHRQHYVDLFDTTPGDIPLDLLQESMDQIVARTNRYLEQIMLQFRNLIINAIEKSIDSTNLKAMNFVHREVNSLEEINSKSIGQVDETFVNRVSKKLLGDELKQAVKTFDANWERSTTGELGLASSAATHQAMQEIYGGNQDDVRVAWITRENDRVCDFCEDASKDEAGNYKYYRMSQFKPSGYNYGKKKKDWELVVPSAHPNCYDDLTEVLTKDGWKLFKDADLSDEYLSVDLESGNAEYVKALEKIDYHYKGEMHHFSSKYADFCVTPKHNHVVKFPITKKGRKKAGVWELLPGDTLPKSKYSYLASIPNWRGKSRDKIIIGDEEFDSLDFMAFLGCYISEGSITKPLFKTGTRRIDVSQKKYKYEMYEIVKKCFPRANLVDKQNSIQIYSKNIELNELLVSLGYSYEKFVPNCFKEYDKEHLEMFFYWFCMGDGSFRKSKSLGGYKSNISRECSTSSEKLSADLAEIILKLGKRPSFSVVKPRPVRHKNGVYTAKNNQILIRECSSPSYHSDNTKKTVIDYDGHVYCLELEKNNTLVTRRNGRVVVSGNCFCTLIYIPTGFKVVKGGDIVKDK